MNRLVLLGALSLSATVFSADLARAEGSLQLATVGRVTFPQRAYVIDLPESVNINTSRVSVRENGAAVKHVLLSPLVSTGLSVGTVLAIDASESMQGSALREAVAAARIFGGRRSANQEVGVLAFNSGFTTVEPLTLDDNALRSSLSRLPRVAYGTRIFDAVQRAMAQLDAAGTSAGSVVLLTDGADVGSRSTTEQVAARARRQHVRIFTVGLKSPTFDPVALRELATATGGSYAEANSPAQLSGIYSALSGRLANEYVLQYRSAVAPGHRATLTISVAGIGSATASYTAPSGARYEPYQRSLLSRFLLSSASLVLLALCAAGLAGLAAVSLFRRSRTTLVDRVGAFVGVEQTDASRGWRSGRAIPRPPRRRNGRGWLDRLAAEFEIGDIRVSPFAFVLVTAVATFLAIIVLALLSPPFALLAILIPVWARSWVVRKVKRVRDSFADQLPETLQLLASALRTGHSFVGALSVVIGQAAEPTKKEFGLVVTDDQIGILIDDSLRRVSVRMASRDMEQVSLLGELQRTAGGNAAEVLDTVVETVRERAEVRGLARTLTAQGRMARWILTAMPFVIGLFLLVTETSLMKPFFTSGLGQVALVGATLSVVSGSLWIKRIIEIKV